MENASKALIIAGAILIALLLVGIGVLLISSGTDITSRGTSGMQSQNIQSFNSSFTAYEGYKKGSELKNLQSAVTSSNATDATHQVDLYLKSGMTNAAGKQIKTLSDLTSSETYTVTLSYAEKDSGNTAVSGGIKIAGSGNAKDKTEQGYVYAILISK